MTVNRTTLLDLPLPVTGTESGTWGDTTNNGLTQYLDIAIAGSLVLSADSDTTLSSTEGDSSATNIGGTTAQYAVLRCTGARTATRNINAPAWTISGGTLTNYSKIYIVVNETTGSQNIVLRATNSATPTYTTGVTIVPGERAVCAWNGSDFVKVGGAAGGTNTQVQYNNAGVFGGITNATTDGTTLSMTSPKVITGINDTNGAELLKVTATASAVNELTLANAAAGNAPTLSATGDDTNIGITLTPKGTGTLFTAGNVSFDGGTFVFNESGADKDFRIEGDTEPNLFFTDASTDRVGIGTSSPSSRLEVSGSSSVVNSRVVNTNTAGQAATQLAANVAALYSAAFGSTAGGTTWAGLTGNSQIVIEAQSSSSFVIGAFNNAAPIIFAQDRAEKMRLDTSGNLGIGTTLPLTPLHAVGAIQSQRTGGVAQYARMVNSGGTATFISDNQASGTYTGFAFQGLSTASGTPVTYATIDGSGNLGLGVTPSGWASTYRAYQVGQAGSLFGLTNDQDRVGVSSNAYFDTTDSRWEYIGTGYAMRYDQNAGEHQWYTAASGAANGAITFTQAMTLDASGNLRVGTTSSGVGKLVSYYSSTAANPLDPQYAGLNVWGSVSVRLLFGTDLSSSYAAYIQASNTGTGFPIALNPSGGYVGIGTISPSSIFDVQQAGTAAATTDLLELTNSGNAASMTNTGTGILFNQFYYDATTPAVADAGRIAVKTEGNWTSTASTQDAYMTFETALDGTVAERARITSGGDLLVGTTNSASNAGNGCKIKNDGGLYVVGTAGDTYNFYNSTAAAYRFYVTSAGVINATSTTITAISDQRLKENIQDIDVGLDKIMALKPRKFDWKEGKGKDKKGDRGWIAQEFEQVFPDMITTWKDEPPEGEEPYKAVNADLIPVLVKAIQEQQALITSLTARVAALEGTQP